MASANFLEEALSTDVDESAVSAIVGSLENQLVTATPAPAGQPGPAAGVSQNHVNSAIPNGGTVPSQKHGAVANGDAVSAPDAGRAGDAKPAEGAKTGPAMSGAVAPSRAGFPNGTIGLAPITPQTVLQTGTSNVQTIQAKQPTLVIKTSAAAGAPGLVTVPMNVTASVPQVNNVGSPTTQTTPNILSNLQVVNVRPGGPAQGQKGQPARVVLSAPQLVGARPGAPVS